MNIVFVAPRYHTNQCAAVLALRQLGLGVAFHANYIGSTEDHETLTPEIYGGCRLSRLLEKTFGEAGGDRPLLFPSPIKYIKEIRELRPDIIIIRNPNRVFSLLAGLAALTVNTRIVFYTQTEIWGRHGLTMRVKSWLLRRCFNAAWYSPIIGNREWPNIPLRGLEYVPFCVRDPVSLVNSPKKGIPVIVMVGKYESKRKNHALLLEAVSSLKERFSFRLVLVGGCSDTSNAQLAIRKLKKQIKSMGLEDLVDLAVNQSSSEMSKIYSSASLFVLPASHEPASISLLEAMSHGVPVICANTCGTRYYIEPDCGLVFEEESATDLEEKLGYLLENTEVLRDMSVRCREAYQKNFSSRAFIKGIESLIVQHWGRTLGRLDRSDVE